MGYTVGGLRFVAIFQLINAPVSKALSALAGILFVASRRKLNTILGLQLIAFLSVF